MATGRSFTLNTGAKIPAVGLGTFRSGPNEVKDAVKEALAVGYRHLDCAFMYKNEDQVGAGIAESGVPRDQIFVTTKLWSSFHSRAEECLNESLQNLKTDYVDLYLMHWPVSLNPNGNDRYLPIKDDGSRDIQQNWDFCKTWNLMEKLLETGKVKAIGVSNFSTKNLDLLLQNAKVVPAVNQVELHPYNPQKILQKYCADKGIHLSAYAPLGSINSTLHDEPVVKQVAQDNGKTVAQVLISWGVQLGFSVLPKSVTVSRIKENFQDFELSQQDMDKLNSITSRRRFFDGKIWGVPVFHDDGIELGAA